ncbi:MAG TPA: ABC transporter ATP-binding protein, partial [Spirochaetaceae bacterium]|nr:ABC transporter ATP-binding protein [Spirochaetaceae bacterium]
DAIGAELERIVQGDQRLEALLEAYHHLDEAINDSGYYRRADRIREVLVGLGFNQFELARRVEELSGGWQMRVALAKVLLENPDIMLLDEPTNYLDLEARDWLEAFLIGYKGGFLVVSHDRSFLDATVNEVYELWNGRLSRYSGSYSAYERQRAQELESLFKSWEAQQEEMARLEDFIRRFRYQASKAAQVQSRVKQLEKIEPIVIPEGMKKVHFSFPPPPHSGRIALTIEGLHKAYGDATVVDELSLIIDSGSKIAFVGRNGAGKSTLMRLIAGRDRDYRGLIRYGTGISAGYFSQDVADELDDSLNVEEEAESACPTALLPGIRSLLGAFLFRGDDVHKSVRVLSGGERSRLALLKMLLHPANLLILDEPTNHLDLDSKDVLLEALKRFQGTVLFVSHDRFFIDGLADQVLELSCGSSPRLFLGDYAYYLDKKAREAAGQDSMGPSALSTLPRAQASIQQAAPLDAKSARELDKKRKADRNRLAKREAELLERIDALEANKASLTAAMALPENYSDGTAIRSLQQQASAIEAELSALSEEWEGVAAELEGLGPLTIS